MKEKLLRIINTMGLFSIPKILGISMYKVIHLIGGVENLTFNQRLRFITDFTKEVGGVSFGEMNSDPITLKSYDEEYHDIVFLGSQKVTIDVLGGYGLSTLIGQYGVSYHNLPDVIFNEIFDLLVEFYYKTYNEDSL
jgi:hypothetical protein